MPRASSALRPTRTAAENHANTRGAPDPSTRSLFAGGPDAPPAAAPGSPARQSAPNRQGGGYERGRGRNGDGNRNGTGGGNGNGSGNHHGGQESGALGFEVRGFATDPKHSGYQILTNYESTYWRAFVGVQAWSLYEVLRSFCHNGNNVCYPSINYLLEVLGIKQRRVLTGWSTEVKGKQYDYPGLIEILQNGGLVIAEVVGEGPMSRYLFHVNLTPDLLRPEQVAELPALLQSKHSEMLQAHFAEMAELASRRRPLKNNPGKNGPAQDGLGNHEAAAMPNPTAQPPVQPAPQSTLPPASPLLPLQNEPSPTKNIVENGGMTNCQTGVTNCHTPSDNLSHKQYQSNNTQLTSHFSTNAINNNRGDLQQGLQTPLLPAALDDQDNQTTDVVVALTDLGLAESVVQRLTTRFSRERILQKIDYLAYLEECHPAKVKNPRGWLRRAVEENYGPPDGYINAQERAAQRAAPAAPSAPVYSVYNDAEALAATQAAKAEALAEREYQRAARRELVRRLAAPDAATLAFWERVQTDVRLTMTPDHYPLIAEASVLWMDDQRVAVAIWDREIYRELLHPNRVKALARTMSSLARCKLDLICEFWDEEGQVAPPGTPPPL